MSFEIPSLPLTEAGWTFAILFALILVVPVLSSRVRLPTVVGFLLAGMLIGPGVAGLLEREGGVELLGTAGLLYLMFIAGLELDLDEFIEHRRAAYSFGASSFLVPMVLGTAAMLALGFSVLAAVLLAACWASHTLVGYPEYQRQGTAGNRAVSVTVGATILTDTAALLVLAVVAGVQHGAIGPAFWLTIVPAIVALPVLTLWVLPAMARRFFSGLGQQVGHRFLFVVTVAFAVAGLAELTGIEGIVGAFLAGLALNRLVPQGSPLMERIEFFGNHFMIPVFLVSVGLLIDPRILIDPQELVLGGAFTVVAVLVKLIAAAGTGMSFGYTRPEIGSMFALSTSRAAGTLAIVLVGAEIGLVSTATLNAVVAVIAITCILSSSLSSRYARQLPPPPSRERIGTTVLVPVARPESTRALVAIAAAMARPDSGFVVPVTVAGDNADEDTLRRVGEAKDQATSMALSHGVEARGVVRIDAAPDLGIRHAAVEHKASLMVLGWTGVHSRREALFGSILDRIVAHVDVPTIIGRVTDDPCERILIVVPTAITTAGGRATFTLAAETARRLRMKSPCPVVVIAQQHDVEFAETSREVVGATYEHRPGELLAILRDEVRPGDLVVLPVTRTRGRVPDLGGRVADALSDTPLLIVMNGTASRVGGVGHGRLRSEFPFGPPPWNRHAQ